jgi:hypothetical protein
MTLRELQNKANEFKELENAQVERRIMQRRVSIEMKRQF